MKTIPLTQLSQAHIQVQDLLVFPRNWKNSYGYSQYQHIPRPCSGLLIICTDIHVHFYEKDRPPVVATRGDVVFLPRGVQYHIDILDSTDDLIDTYTLHFLLQDETGEELLLSDHIQVITNRQDELFSIRAAAVSSAFHQAEPRNKLRLNAAFYHLLDAIASNTEETNASYYPIRIGVEMLRSQWNENRKIEEYAELCGVGTAYFYRCFRRWCGKSPVQYRNEIRLSNAETMLHNTDLPINEISRTVGFTDAFYFCRLFAKTYGLSPKKYRSAFNYKESEL